MPQSVDLCAARGTFRDAGGRRATASQLVIIVLFAGCLVPISLAGAPQPMLLVLALFASVSGLLVARLNRKALIAGFSTVENVQPGTVYTTRRIYLVAPFIVLFVLRPPFRPNSGVF